MPRKTNEQQQTFMLFGEPMLHPLSRWQCPTEHKVSFGKARVTPDKHCKKVNSQE